MATVTTDNTSTRNHTDSDREITAGWDRQQAMDDWFESAGRLQSTYLDFVTRSFRLLLSPVQRFQQN